MPGTRSQQWRAVRAAILILHKMVPSSWSLAPGSWHLLRRRLRIPSAAFARNQDRFQDLVPGPWFLAPDKGLVAQLVRARA